jgi:hypothetical protein
VLAFQQHAEFELEESRGGGETASQQRVRRQMPRKITIPRTRRSDQGCPVLEANDARERAPKVVNQPAALYASTDLVLLGL